MDPHAFYSRRCRILWAICHTATIVDVPRLHSISIFLLAGRDKKGICQLVYLTRSPVRWRKADFGCSAWALFCRDCVAEHGRTSYSTLVLSPYEILSGGLCFKFGYTNRAAWSVGFVAIGFSWPMTSWPEKDRAKLFWPWAVGCFVSAMFPLLPVDPSESLATM